MAAPFVLAHDLDPIVCFTCGMALVRSRAAVARGERVKWCCGRMLLGSPGEDSDDPAGWHALVRDGGPGGSGVRVVVSPSARAEAYFAGEGGGTK